MARIYRVAANSIALTCFIMMQGCSPIIHSPSSDELASHIPPASSATAAATPSALGQSVPTPAIKTSVKRTPTTCADAPTLYALSVRDDMEQRANVEMQTTRYGGGVLMVLAGVVGYKAAAGKANSHGILALTAAGTAGYGIGTIVTSQDRINTYLAGASAVQCAISLSEPFMPPAGFDPDKISDDSVMGRYANARNELLKCNTPCDKAVKTCTGLDTSDLITQLDQAHTAFVAYSEEAKQVGFALCQASDGVRVKVNQMIGSKNGDISALAVKLSAFTTKGPAASGTSARPPSGGNLSAIDSESPTICQAYPQISSYILKSEYLPGVPNASNLQSLANSCSMASIDKTQTLTVDQSVFKGNAVKIPAGQEAIGAISGGSGNYIATPTISSSGNIKTIVIKSGDASSLEIDASKAATTGETTTVTVKDDAGQSVAIVVTVEAKS